MDISVQAIMAAFLSFLVAFIIFTAVGIVICKRATRSQTQATQAPEAPPASTRITVPNPTPHPTTMATEVSQSFDPKLQISMSDIITATKNFSADLIIGDGRFGPVYRAELPNGLKLAVKKLDPDAFQCFMEFRSELEILGMLRHRNVVRLLGYRVTGAERVLIYEFYEKGNLDICLHGLFSESSRLQLCWKTRNKILRGVANGLADMHEWIKPIIHRDVKSENIFLDSEFEAYIADFGLARMVEAQNSHVSSLAAGTVGYMPPEYEDGCAVATVKGDVFSFGILMLEIATRKRPNLPVIMNKKSMSFLEWAKDMVAQNREREMLDRDVRDRVSGGGLNESTIKEHFRIAFMCTHPILRERPTMREVVELLTRNST